MENGQGVGDNPEVLPTRWDKNMQRIILNKEPVTPMELGEGIHPFMRAEQFRSQSGISD